MRLVIHWRLVIPLLPTGIQTIRAEPTAEV